MSYLHEVVKVILHAQVEGDDECEEQYLDRVFDEYGNVLFIPLEFLEKKRESARSVDGARFYVPESEFLFFFHYLLPRWGGTVIVTPLGAKRKMFFVICCMEPFSA